MTDERNYKKNTLSEYIAPGNFETLYIQLREKEGRIYSDEEVVQLPAVPVSHIHYKEWLARKESSQRLIRYLKKKKRELDILETGCGNGWLSHHLSAIPGSRVIGVDINFSEIQQAARVFQHIPNLHFIYTYAEQEVFGEKRFDAMIFAASIQYFESLPETISNNLRLLKPGGELHIIDSPFYSWPEVLAARQRTKHYYESAGFSGMADFYFHHCLDDLKKFNYCIQYDPKNIFNRVLGNKNPFPWISIRRGATADST